MMEQAKAIIRCLDMQLRPLQPEQTLAGEVGSPIQYEVPTISGYKCSVQLVIGLGDDDMPSFVEPGKELNFQANKTLIIEIRYQKLPAAEPVRADAKQWVAQADHKFLVKSQQDVIPVFDDDNQPLEQTVLQPNTFGTYTSKREIGNQTYYQIAPHQWVQASDIVVVSDKSKTNQPELWQVTPVNFRVEVKVPDNMAVVLWQINPQTLAETKLEAHLVDNGTELNIDQKIIIAGELFYHIANSEWIKAKYVSRK